VGGHDHHWVTTTLFLCGLFAMNIATTMKTTNAKELMKMIGTGALTTIRDLLVALLAGAVVAGLAAVASG
jgi:hypothetical protein